MKQKQKQNQHQQQEQHANTNCIRIYTKEHFSNNFVICLIVLSFIILFSFPLFHCE